MALTPKEAVPSKPKVYMVEIMGLKPVKAITGAHGETNMPCPDLLMGMELEMEGFPRLDDEEPQFGGVKFVQDGSLRNNGIEGVTAPMAVKYLPSFLRAFYNKFEITQERNYSDRCSTHVHINVQDMKPSQVVTVCLLYQAVERLLFEFVGNDRKNNIYCVPWYQSGLTAQFAHGVLSNPFFNFRKWQKYSALNLIPITTQGTLEFRHLHGTCDVDFISNWLALLARMFDFAKRTELDEAKEQIINMNTVSNYREWLYSVFGPHGDLLTIPRDYEAQLAQGVIDTKLMLVEQPQPAKSIYADLLIRDTFFDEDRTEVNDRAEVAVDHPQPPVPQQVAAPHHPPMWWTGTTRTWEDMVRRTDAALNQPARPVGGTATAADTLRTAHALRPRNTAPRPVRRPRPQGGTI